MGILWFNLIVYVTILSYPFAAKRNTRGPCRQLKTAKVTRVTNSRISIGYDERHRVAPTADLHSSLAHDIGHVVRTHCPMQWKSWKVIPDEIKMQVRGQLSVFFLSFNYFSFKLYIFLLLNVCNQFIADELRLRGHQRGDLGVRQQTLR